jgi:outer membrane protein OmpA-like peptidoglycan-associated protein
MSGLSLRDDEPGVPEPPPKERRGVLALALYALLGLLVAGLGFLGYQEMQHRRALEAQVAALQAQSIQSAALARQAQERATAAEASARAAAEGRQQAEVQTSEAQKQAEAAQKEAGSAREAAAQAQAEADRIRKRAEGEVNRLEAALGQIAETRRTQLGLIMNLGSDHLKFEFDRAELRPEDKELLARIAGILMTSHDYTVSVNGHTDDVGSAAYNQALSERRARAVHDYLVKAGMSPDILSVQGHGKSRPLVPGTSETARAKNRRVELGIVNTQIRYGRP